MTDATEAATSAPPSAPDPTVGLMFADLDAEFAATRRVLERYPQEHGAWKPHEKSMTLEQLARHVAGIPMLARIVLETDEFDRATTSFPTFTASSAAEMVALFERTSAALRDAVNATSAEALGREWKMRAGEQVFVSGQKAALVRRLGLTHLAHHRGQLTVYYRLLGVSVPSTHGPTADEGVA